MVLRDLPIPSNGAVDSVELKVSPDAGVLDLSAVFGNARPVELEIGTGKGRFLMLAATAQPEINFLGLEYARRYLAAAIERTSKRGLTNVRLVHAEAVSFLTQHIGDASLAAAHIYFPDPWPKKRHHKRRFVQAARLDLLARVLKPGALLRVATDHADYAAAIVAALSAHAAFEDAGQGAALWELPAMGDYTAAGVTNFEIKYLREGRPIRRFAWRRR
jgi:tRNA (guanine-N7-)-methyltransferase